MRYSTSAPSRAPLLCALLALGLTSGLILLLAGCGSSAPVAVSADPGPLRNANRVAADLRRSVARWEGTPYRFGGTSQRGVDCSGFVQALYRDVLDVSLTRSTRSQVRHGRRVRADDLRAGDLVFFRTAAKTRHVGVYVGDGEFAHASTSEGVTITPLARDYWQEAYWTARRVLRLEASPDADGGDATYTTERAGW